MLWKVALVVVVLVVLGWVGTMALFSVLSRKPDRLGIRAGELAPCPPSPNCVCTRDTDPGHAIEPLRFRGPPEEAWKRLRGILERLPRTRIVSDDGTYLHVESTSLLFRFVDDVEFRLDAGAGLIHFRSASRAGHSDLGVNRTRMEEIRRVFEKGA